MNEQVSGLDEPEVRHSRATRLGTAVSQANQSSLAARLDAAHIQLSVDLSTSGAADVARVLVATLRRQPGTIYVDPSGSLPRAAAEDLAEELRERAATIDPHRPLVIGQADRPTAVIHLGAEERAPVRVIPDSHGVRLARRGKLQQSRPPTGLGVVLAAAIAAGEIFKCSADVYPHLRNDDMRLDFCPVTLSDDLQQAPLDIPGALDLTLVGLGAVGTATALTLSLLNTSGRVVLIDDECLAEENLGTYSLGGVEDATAGVPKVDVAAATLTAFDCYPFRGSVEQAIREIDCGRLPWTVVVMSGLDSVDARRATQLLWPDLLIDSSTGDTAVGVRVCPNGDACLMCLLQESKREVSAMTQLIELTGLSRDDLTAGSRLVTEYDVERAKPEIRSRMRRAVGMPVCGLGRAIGIAEGGEDDYRPSIPFVAQQAACLGVGRLIAHLHGLAGNTGLPTNLVQYDTLLGPTQLSALRLKPREDCYSVIRRPIIEQVRMERRLR